MELVGRERKAAQGEDREPAAPTRPLPLSDAGRILALQRTAGNHAVARMLSPARGPVIQRQLDEDFEHAGTPTADEARIAKEFAAIVSGLVDEAHLDLLAGRVKDWKGAKITTFLDLLMRGSPAALVHAGNVIEERVYALMKAAALPCEWTPQFAEGMGSASKPDIVAHVSDEHDALIDVTSARNHILGKVGGWTTSKRYVYVAEAWFPSVLAAHLPHIRDAVKAGGVDGKALAEMRKAVEAERANRIEQRKQEVAEARALFKASGNFTAFARDAFGDDKIAAAEWMREKGLGHLKGVPRKKGPRKVSDESKEARKRKAAKEAYQRRKEARAEEESRKDEEELADGSDLDDDEEVREEDESVEREDELEADEELAGSL